MSGWLVVERQRATSRYHWSTGGSLKLDHQPPPSVSLHYLTLDRRRRREYVSQSMSLLIGYSTIPVAPIAFSCGTMLRTTDSSTIVITSTQSGSESAEMVGF